MGENSEKDPSIFGSEVIRERSLDPVPFVYFIYSRGRREPLLL